MVIVSFSQLLVRPALSTTDTSPMPVIENRRITFCLIHLSTVK